MFKILATLSPGAHIQAEPWKPKTTIRGLRHYHKENRKHVTLEDWRQSWRV